MTRRKERGSSLVEALVAMALILFSLLAVAPLFVFAARESLSDASMGAVSAAAVRRLELLNAQSYSTLAVGGRLSANDASFFDDSDPRVLVRWQIAKDAALELKTIRVRAVARRIDLGPAKAVTLVTVRGR